MTIPRTAATTLLLATLIFGAPGCATISTGTSQTVWISSSPPGARVTVLPENVELVTPAEVRLARRRSHTVRFQLDGYRPAIEYIDPLIVEPIGENVVLGGLLGVTTDIATGAAWMLGPEVIHANLEPLPAQARE